MNNSSIPNFFTFLNLSLGIIAIVLCFDGMMFAASVCVLTAGVIDRYDGMIARKFNSVSLLGKELDSLSDLVSFGVAPAIIAWKICFSSNILGYIPLVIFPICGTFRLARYNVSDFKNTYTGMPITIAGTLLSLDSIAAVKFGQHSAVSLVFMLLLAYLMVSKIQVKKV